MPTDLVSLKAIALLPLSHYITTVVASLLTAVNALSFEMDKSQTQEIFRTFLQLLDLLGLCTDGNDKFPCLFIYYS